MGMKKKKKYGNPSKEKAYRENLKKEKLDSLYDFLVAFMKRVDENDMKLLIGQDIAQFDNAQLMIDLGIALSTNDIKLTDITSHSKPYEITAAVPNKKGTFNLISAIFNESEIVMWMPNIEKSMVHDAAEFLKLNRTEIIVKKYRKFYPEFAA